MDVYEQKYRAKVNAEINRKKNQDKMIIQPRTKVKTRNIDKSIKKETKSKGWKPTYKTILKSSPRATYVINTSRPKTSFEKEYQKEKNLLAWD
jgi:hypothetical protein